MKTVMRYFRYHLIRQIPYLLIAAGISVLFSLIPTFENRPVTTFSSPKIGYPAMVLCALSALTPIVQLSLFKRRRNLDNLFSLPLSRKKMLAVHWGTGLLINTVIFGLCMLITALRIAKKSLFFDVFYLFPAFLLGVVWGGLLYAFFAFLFYEGNTTADGTVFVFLYCWIQLPVGGVLEELLPKAQEIGTFVQRLCPFYPMVNLFDYYSFLVERNDSSAYRIHLSEVTSSISLLILGIAAAVGFFLFSSRKRVEKTEEISESFFGYRVLLPLLCVCMFYIAVKASMIILSIMFLAFAIGGYAFYRRGFRFKIWDWILIGVLFLGSILENL